MTTLNKISDNQGARKSRIRVGRGIGSTKGKTGGRGVKGQTSRSGVAIKGYEGGQMPIHMRLPKRGFKNLFRLDYNVINLDQLQKAVDDGKFAAGSKVDVATLVSVGILRRAKDGVRLLARGELKAKLALEVAGASEAAKVAVEKAGGSVTVIAAKVAAAE
ncbi:MAG: 50S ribosomal protein L15 [Parvibaculum sedimenti]|uniref:50S ribosomal protein L15 n=1 Tax=Parvibaculum sedimenti TaxID=2608632 RepID=UPI003BB812F5